MVNYQNRYIDLVDEITVMLDEISEDLQWLIELGYRHVDHDYSEDRAELVRLAKKYHPSIV